MAEKLVFKGVLRGLVTATAKQFNLSHTAIRQILNKGNFSARDEEIISWMETEARRLIEEAKKPKLSGLMKVIQEAEKLNK